MSATRLRRTSKRPGRPARRNAAALSLAILTLLVLAATALAVPGQLTQLPGLAGCISEDGDDNRGETCADGKALETPNDLAVSPDGRNVYVAAGPSFGNAVAVFQRNTTTGELTQLEGLAGCVSETGSGIDCTPGRALNGASSVAVSPDGKNVYVASSLSDAVAVFARDPTTGQLTQLSGAAGCVSQTGSNGICADGRALNSAVEVRASADGNNVYVVSVFTRQGGGGGGAVAVFHRNTTTGELTQLAGSAGCIRDPAVASCRVGRELAYPSSLAVSPDGKSVYLSSPGLDSVAVMRRNTTSGALFQSSRPGGCISETGSGGSCTDGKALGEPRSVAVSPDAKNLYVASYQSDALAIFRRSPTTGALTQLVGPAGKAGCVSLTGSGGECQVGRALSSAYHVTVSPDGASVYEGQLVGQAIAIFRRDTTNGVLTQPAGKAGCVADSFTTWGCAIGKALGDAEPTVSPDGKNVYFASFFSDAVAVFSREVP